MCVGLSASMRATRSPRLGSILRNEVPENSAMLSLNNDSLVELMALCPTDYPGFRDQRCAVVERVWDAIRLCMNEGLQTRGLEQIRAAFSPTGHTVPLIALTCLDQPRGGQSGCSRGRSETGLRSAFADVRVSRSRCNDMGPAPMRQPIAGCPQARLSASLAKHRSRMRPQSLPIAPASDQHSGSCEWASGTTRPTSRLPWRISNRSCQVNNRGARLSTIRAELRNATAGIRSFTILKKRIAMPFSALNCNTRVTTTAHTS